MIYKLILSNQNYEKILQNLNKCILCKDKKLITFLKLEKFPKKMGKKITSRKHLPNLNMKVCSSCWHVQVASVSFTRFLC